MKTLTRSALSLGVLMLLLGHAAPAQEDDTEWNIEYCKWVSLLAKDIMTARQDDAPMSETLPFALDRVDNFFYDMGVDFDELDEEEAELALQEADDFAKEMKPLITKMVMGFYEAPVWTVEMLQTQAISEAENATFASCFGGMESED